MSRRRLNQDGTSKRYPSDETHRPNKRGADPHSDRVSSSDILTYEITDMPYVIGDSTCRISPDIPDGTMWGEYSFYIPSERKRFIPTKYLRHYRGWHTNRPVTEVGEPINTDVWDTESGWARRWLRTIPPRNGYRKWDSWYERSQRPYWYKPGRIDNAVYIDIKAAYPSIYERASWHINYRRGQYMSLGGEQLTWPYDLGWKVGRSYIVTAAQNSTSQRIVMGGRLYHRKVRNRNMNKPFWSFVMDTLSAIAVYAVAAFDAIYYNCDGAIIPDRHLGSYISFCSSVGITTSVKARGNAHVTESGFWKVGHRATKPYILTKGETTRSAYLKIEYPPIDMALDEASWILNHFETLPTSRRAG